jgi:phenylalanyl-tRNA synthetase alpha chain
MIKEIYDFFVKKGYEITESKEIENESYNFDRLNIPKNHPARDMHDTFYLDKK